MLTNPLGPADETPTTRISGTSTATFHPANVSAGARY
jgi:hypothetical protein